MPPAVLRAAAAVAGGVVAGLAVGLVGTFVHASTVTVAGAAVPVGTLVALGATASVVLVAGLLTGSRLGPVGVLVGWLGPVLLLAAPRPEGDLVLPARPLAYVWLYGGTLLCGIGVALPYGLLRTPPGRGHGGGRREAGRRARR